MATNSKDIDLLIKGIDSNLSVDRRSKAKRRSRNEADANLSDWSIKDENTKILINYIVENIHVSEFLHNHEFLPSTDEDEYSGNNISLEEKYINSLLEKRKAEKLCSILKENRELEETLVMKKMQLIDISKERNAAWKKAEEVLKSTSPKLFNTLDEYFSTSSQNSSEYSASNISGFEGDNSRNECKMKRNQKIKEKYELIQEIAGVLHMLISFSGTQWATEKTLLLIVLCTGKILNRPFFESNPRELERFVMECMLKLNEVKWEHL